MNKDIKTVLQAIDSHLQSSKRCAERKNSEWHEKHSDYVLRLIIDFMPHGCGFDSGTKLIERLCADNKIVFRADFHHMNDVGLYDGWSEHTVIVTPAFTSFNVRVTGKDKRNIKEYIGDLFHECLSEKVRFSETKDRYIKADSVLY